MDAGDDVLAALEDAVLENLRLIERAAVYLDVHGDVPAKQVAVQVHDVGLAAAHEAHALPLARPAGVVVEELEVAHVLLGVEHGAVVVRRGKELEARVASSKDVLANRGVGVARVERVGVGVAQVLEHG